MAFRFVMILLATVVLILLNADLNCDAAVLKWKPESVVNDNTILNRDRSKSFLTPPLTHQQKNLDSVTTSDNGKVSIDVTCDICKVIVTVIRDLTKLNKSREEIADCVSKVCIDLKVEDQRVCQGITDVFKEEVLSVFAQLVLSTDEVCGLLVGDTCGSPYNPFAHWNITLPSTPKPPVVPLQPPKVGSPQLRVLHLSDIHVDRQYKAGGNANCGEPLCCRQNDGEPVGEPAGEWGDYHCDTPTWTLESLFQHLQQNEKFDYILWTGDLPGHSVWTQTQAEQLELLDYLAQLLDQYFPSTPIYSALGNHESAPVNSFPPPFITGNDSIHWLYAELLKDWTKWLPKETESNINKGAFYSAMIKPGFRMISLNTNYCNTKNFWLYINSTDPAGELTWLLHTLQTAEEHGEKVHIIGHIPPGVSSCLQAWSWNYYKIVNRYESTIAGQFFGHTHYDSVELFYDPPTPSNSSKRRVTQVAYIGPSVTTYSNLNPAYRVYTVDGFYNGSTWAVLDHETYVMNLTRANQASSTQKQPEWKKEYSAKDAYNMSSLFPRDWDAVLGRLQSNDTLLQQYYRFYYHEHPPTPACNGDCRRQLLCDLQTARSHDSDMCAHVNVTHAGRDGWLHEQANC